MTDWQQLLRENDPGQERMDADTVRQMRDAVVRVAAASPRPRALWPMRVALAGFACVVMLLSIAGTRNLVTPDPVVRPASGERRQIQFATPGGTRIIWQINPDFTLGETIP